MRLLNAGPSRYASSPSSAPLARTPIGPDDPPAPSTIWPDATATAAVNAPPSSTSTNDVSSQPIPIRDAWSTIA